MTRNWQPMQLRLAQGLDLKSDPRASDPPQLDIALNIQFDNTGGLQTRKPYGLLGNQILGGGTLGGFRKIIEHNGELIVFTSDTLYTWNAQLQLWCPKGTHLAVSLTETQQFTTTDDQIDSDRAQLANTVVFTWSSSIGRVYAAALDTVTGSVLLSPFFVGNGHRPRVVALDTKILLFVSDGAGGNLNVWALDPANLATTVAGAPTHVQVGATNINYDVTRVFGVDEAILVCQQTPTTSYQFSVITAALVITTTIKARTADGPLAVSCTPDGLHAQVIRTSTTNVQGDLLTISTGADVFTAQAIGTLVTTCNQLTAAHTQNTVGGHYRCYAFWESGTESLVDASFEMRSNWVDDSGAIGGIVGVNLFCKILGCASRAFGYLSNVFLWGVFAEASNFTGSPSVIGTGLQNTYFLYRNDAFLVAKSHVGIAGGYSGSVGHLPGVALTAGSTGFSWCGTDRRLVPAGNAGAMAYTARSPRDVTFIFDSNDARRTARMGDTLYIACGEGVLQYDGAQITEVGFHIYPYYFAGLQVPGAGGTVDVGTYGVKVTDTWINANAERERSTTATIGTVTISALPGASRIGFENIIPNYFSHKSGISKECWRTKVNAPPNSPFFLVTQFDPSTAGADNGFIANDPTVDPGVGQQIFDNFTDAIATTKTANPENDSILESLAPPPATIILASDNRIFLAGIAGVPDQIWYSTQRNAGEIAAFNDGLFIDLPYGGGAITGLQVFNETLIAFRQFSIYALPGIGLDNAGGGSNFGPAVRISGDVGAVSMESIIRTEGGLFFKSSKGFYQLDSKWQLSYVGGPVAAYDTDTVLAAHIIKAQHQIRVLTNARMLVFDYLVNQWAEWTVNDGVHAVVWSGLYTYLSGSGPKTEQPTFALVNYSTDVELSWLKLADLQGAGSVRRIQPLGGWMSTCSVRMRIARDYESDGAGGWAYFDDETYVPINTLAGDRLQFAHRPTNRKCSAIKVRITTTGAGGEMIQLTGLGLEVGVLPKLNRRLSAAQKV